MEWFSVKLQCSADLSPPPVEILHAVERQAPVRKSLSMSRCRGGLRSTSIRSVPAALTP